MSSFTTHSPSGVTERLATAGGGHGEHERPLGGYAGLTAVFTALAGAFAAWLRRSERSCPSGLVVAPRATRWVASVLSAVFGSDVLQIAYRQLEDSL